MELHASALARSFDRSIDRSLSVLDETRRVSVRSYESTRISRPSWAPPLVGSQITAVITDYVSNVARADLIPSRSSFP